MISFTIDTSELSQEFSLTKQDVDKMMKFTLQNVAGEFARTWADVARKGLNSTRSQYLRAIQTVDEGPLTTAVVLVGEIANGIESGRGAFDMKPGFASSAKRKNTVGKDGKAGWYVTVPFRFASAGTTGESDVFSGSMPSPIYAIAKAQKTTIPTVGGMKSAGLTAGQLPTAFSAPSVRPAVSNIPESKSFQAYQHKSSIYEGISKVKDNATGQNSYVSFRRISDKSDANAWINPGTPARNFGDEAIARVDVATIVDQSVDTFLSSLGF